MRTRVVCLTLLLLVVRASAFPLDDDGKPLLPRGLAPFETVPGALPALELTPPPQEPVRATAEWEEVEAIMVRWPNSTSWNLLWANILRPIALDLRIYVICGSASQVTSARTFFLAHSVPVDSMTFQVHATNSIWIRDYGPWWNWRESSHDRAIVDWIYNRPRPADDSIPRWQATLWSLPYYGPNLVFTGGNFMVDGWGRGFCSNLVINENLYSRPEFMSLLHDYMNLDTVYTFPRFFGIDHIDMSMKLLNDHTAILNRFPDGDSFNAVMDSCEETLAPIQNPWGENISVTRINTPSWSGEIPYTYTNGILINHKALVPVYGLSQDSAALAIWQSLLPGYQVFGVNCNDIIVSEGAIHCVIKEVMHRHLIRVEFAPLPAVLANSSAGVINARITSLGTLDPDSVQLFYSVNDGLAWFSTPFVSLGGDSFHAQIPAQLPGVSVYYYVRAKNVEGNWTTMPRYGPGAHYVTAFPPYTIPPAAPDSVVIRTNGNDLILNWSSVSLDTDGNPILGITYKIFRGFDLETIIAPDHLVGQTATNGLTIAGAASDGTLTAFYQVVAVSP